MTPDDRRGEVSDEQLDSLLSTANEELLSHLQVRIKPIDILVIIRGVAVNSDDCRRGEVSDEQLDSLLSTANEELLSHLQVRIEPIDTLATLMSTNDSPRPPGQKVILNRKLFLRNVRQYEETRRIAKQVLKHLETATRLKSTFKEDQ